MRKYIKVDRQGNISAGYVKKPAQGKDVLLQNRESMKRQVIESLKTCICPYCCGHEPLGTDSAGDYITIESDGRNAAIESDSWGFDIDYCPKCGRKL